MHSGAGGSYAGIVLAAGSGTRVGHGGSKAYLPLAGRAMLVWALETLAGTGGVERLVLAVRAQDLELAGEVLERELPGVAVDLVAGGAIRHESEHRALGNLASDICPSACWPPPCPAAPPCQAFQSRMCWRSTPPDGWCQAAASNW